MPNPIHTLDLNFQGIPGTIAAYLIPHRHGAVLVESGPGSTQENLSAALAKHGYAPKDVTDVLLTHIHLDHAGAAGWLARQGARIHVHPVGAPHMLEPERLLKSATRIYGELMEPLWGQFLPVPEEMLLTPQDQDEIEIAGLVFKAIDTPGHAFHHYVYLFEGTCFSGDVGGIRLQEPPPYLRLPTPPPEFHLEEWRLSLKKLQQAGIQRIAPTHFGIHADIDWHLAELAKALDKTEQWMQANLPGIQEPPAARAAFTDWSLQDCRAAGMAEAELHAYELAMPLGMGADGLWRYWHKVRNAPDQA
jgi:glyoxylase-like metal-dependent hydrolase (beta-lactamase superfamily II)